MPARPGMAERDQFKLPLGSPASDFSLPGTDGKTHTLAETKDAKALLVVFSCNHCPYAQAWEGRIIELARTYAPKGLATLVINPNETVNYPDDRMERMVERARDQHYPFPYLRDDSQGVARAYGAEVTPHPFLFDRSRRLVFQGKVDDNHQDPSKVRHTYLRDAIEATLSGKPVPVATTSVIGCSVKWRP